MHSWEDMFRIVCCMIVGTACVTSFMLLTAKVPSADDFWRGVGSFVMGAGSIYFCNYLGNK